MIGDIPDDLQPGVSVQASIAIGSVVLEETTEARRVIHLDVGRARSTPVDLARPPAQSPTPVDLARPPAQSPTPVDLARPPAQSP